MKVINIIIIFVIISIRIIIISYFIIVIIIMIIVIIITFIIVIIKTKKGETSYDSVRKSKTKEEMRFWEKPNKFKIKYGKLKIFWERESKHSRNVILDDGALWDV